MKKQQNEGVSLKYKLDTKFNPMI